MLPQYLKDIGYPQTDQSEADFSKAAEVLRIVEWMTRRAIRLTYGDKWQVLSEPLDIWEGRSVGVVQGAAENKKVASAVQNILDALGVDEWRRYGSTPQRIGAAAKLISQIVDKEVEQKEENGMETDMKVIENKLRNVTLGMQYVDENVLNGAKILRLLHVESLRKLQDDINSVISDMQAVTANPKTNASLGKVGR